MIDINEALKQRFGPFSLEGLRARFRYPNWYVANSAADFLEHRDKIQPTPDNSFLMDPRTYVDAAAIVIHNCFYEQHHEPLSRQELGYWWDMDFRALKLYEKLGILSDEQQQELNRRIVRYHNASIFDQTGRIPFYSPYQIAEGIRFDRVWLLYRPGLDLTSLADFHFNGGPAKGKVEESESLLDKILPLVPEPFPR